MTHFYLIYSIKGFLGFVIFSRGLYLSEKNFLALEVLGIIESKEYEWDFFNLVKNMTLLDVPLMIIQLQGD